VAPTTGFADRLAYVRWLRMRGRVAFENDREFAEALGVTYGWFAKWKSRRDAPEARKETNALARALEPMGVTYDWLFDNIGEAPEPEMWRDWLRARRKVPFYYYGEEIKKAASG